jgi:CRISPR-associated protein Cas2
VTLLCFVVTYDISCPKRWRKVYRILHGFGEHVQLSVFRCDLTATRLAELRAALDDVIHHIEDQVLIVKVGPTASTVPENFDVLGRQQAFRPPGSTVV